MYWPEIFLGPGNTGENVSPIGSRMATFDGASSPSELSQFFNTHKPLSVPAATLTGWNRRIFLHLKLFNLSAPFLKIVNVPLTSACSTCQREKV